MTDAQRFVVINFFTGGTNTGIDNVRNAMALQWAAANGCKPEVQALILARRRDWLNRAILLQRHWQTKVSRCPQRGRHHDSWSIRERYVRGNG